MIEQLKWFDFNKIDCSEPFFDTLKEDYPKFEEWFSKKKEEHAKALVYKSNDKIGAFLYLKKEYDRIILKDKELSKKRRIKIGTLKLEKETRGQRLGEGIIGFSLWCWQESDYDEIYVTIYPKQKRLVQQFNKFGFSKWGEKEDGEYVMGRSKKTIDYTSAYSSFPFINPNIQKAGFVIVNDEYHDTLFPFSELANVKQEQMEIAAVNGLTKVYIGGLYSHPPYKVGDLVFIYRRHTKDDNRPKKYLSCITSFCIVTDIVYAKSNNMYLMKEDEFRERIANKSVFKSEEIIHKYYNDKNLILIEMLYYGYFGAGNNINYDWLIKNGYFRKDVYPANILITKKDYERILQEGEINVSNVIVN